MGMVPKNERIDPRWPFYWREWRYWIGRRCPQHQGEGILPDLGSVEEERIRWYVVHVLGPLRDECGLSVHVVGGGGYDPIYHPESGLYCSHRGKWDRKTGALLQASTTQHRYGATDILLGSNRAEQAFPSPWTLERTRQWFEARFRLLGLGGGLGVYPLERQQKPDGRILYSNGFIHGDPRPTRARWQG